MSVVVLFLMVIADGVVPPVPSEALLLTHLSAAAAAGWPALLGLGALAALAAVLGDAITYLLGSRIGTDCFAWQRRPWVARILGRTRAALDRRGVPLIVSARLLPGWRVAITFLAGASGLPLRKFLLASALGSTMWASYMVGIGATVGALTGAGPIVVAAISLVTMAALGQVVRWIRRARRWPSVSRSGQHRSASSASTVGAKNAVRGSTSSNCPQPASTCNGTSAPVAA